MREREGGDRAGHGRGATLGEQQQAEHEEQVIGAVEHVRDAGAEVAAHAGDRRGARRAGASGHGEGRAVGAEDGGHRAARPLVAEQRVAARGAEAAHGDRPPGEVAVAAGDHDRSLFSRLGRAPLGERERHLTLGAVAGRDLPATLPERAHVEDHRAKLVRFGNADQREQCEQRGSRGEPALHRATAISAFGASTLMV